MPRVPPTSPATGNTTHPHFIHTQDFSFVDNHGRTLLLRGVNLSGASKAPVDHLSYLLDDFWDSAEEGGESFVGRPLNLEDGSADVHLARLRGWGFNLLRLPFTWEALERQGPRKYDYEFMDYLIRVLCKCREYGFRVYMDPHQDAWSRFSGGSGAPFWTLAACGINPANITATQAAIIHCEYPLPHDPDPASVPAMTWSTNYGRLLSQTLFTFFFAGRTFAPNCIIDNVNIQDYLQNHYIEAVGQLADRIRDFEDGSLFEETIIGWEPLNEPFEGLVGWDDLNLNPTKQGSTLKKGTYPTPIQGFRLGMGQAQTVDNYSFGGMGPRRDGSVTIDPKGRKLWADPDSPSSSSASSSLSSTRQGELPDGTHPRWGWKRDVSKWPLGTCPWALHGVWDIETGYVLQPNYFQFFPPSSSPSSAPTPGTEVSFLADFWKPHWQAYAARIRQSHPETIMFVQPPVFAIPPPMDEDTDLKHRCVYAPHYYDGLTLVTRHWGWFNVDALGVLRGKYSSPLSAVRVGEQAIRKVLSQQLGYFLEDAKILGRYPTLMGEIGIPYDMDSKRSYGWTEGGKGKGDYSAQEKALDASLNACDGAMETMGREDRAGGSGSDGGAARAIHWTVWTYVPDDHSHDWGDGWNMEDLSLFSRDDLKILGKGPVSAEANENANASSLTLVKQGSPKPSKSISRSPSPSPTTSSSTFDPPSPISLSSTGKPFPFSPTTSYDPQTGWTPNPYDFLVNGSRASRAFIRPYPMKVVGRPVEIKFDFAKATFKMVVRVGWEDGTEAQPAFVEAAARRNRVGGQGERRRGKDKRGVDVRVDVVPAVEDEDDDEREGEGIREEGRIQKAAANAIAPDDDEDDDDDPSTLKQPPTEIYIPLVHYAHPKILESSALRNGWARWPEEGEGQPEDGDDVDDADDGEEAEGRRRGRTPVRSAAATRPPTIRSVRSTRSITAAVVPAPLTVGGGSEVRDSVRTGTASTDATTSTLGTKTSTATMLTTATDLTTVGCLNLATTSSGGLKPADAGVSGAVESVKMLRDKLQQPKASATGKKNGPLIKLGRRGEQLVDIEVKISGPSVVSSSISSSGNSNSNGSRGGVEEEMWPGRKKTPKNGGPGRWEVDGQTLKWWYDVPPPPPSQSRPSAAPASMPPSATSSYAPTPASSSSHLPSHPHNRPLNVPVSITDSSGGTEMWEYTIEIKRKGGPLKSLVELEKERERLMSSSRGLGSDFCESLCPQDGCVVM